MMKNLATLKNQWSNDPQHVNEKAHTEIRSTAHEAAVEIAGIIAEEIKESQQENRKFVLGLATGATPVGIYEELVRLHQKDGLSFKNVITFNLDEYFPMKPAAMQSYVRFMQEHLFNHIDIPPENIHIPDGSLEKEQLEQYCLDYEKKIEQAGGIDMQLLGIGRTGHIGFNEPGSSATSRTRVIFLDKITRVDAAADFFGEEHVPHRAITMGIGTILKSRQIILMAWGEGKASIVARAVEEPVSSQIPATYLQNHPNITCFLDTAAAVELSQKKHPWLQGTVNWDEDMKKKAVIWLAFYLKKPILKLTESDYSEHGMEELMVEHEKAYSLNIRIFRQLQQTITGWPGGKPNEDDRNRPERAMPAKKRVLIFSPHPDDDVISMGGTFIRLVDQGHEVHVAYQTSGNIAVFNDYILQQLDFVRDMATAFAGNEAAKFDKLYKQAKEVLENKHAGEPDPETIQVIKGLIRKSEARAGCRFSGIPDEHAHFLDLPFYETGLVKKKPLGVEDIDITEKLIRKLRPHQIFAAGDLSDPHGTHRVCLDAVFQAVQRLKEEDFMQNCRIWLYRGAWQEWQIEDIDMAVPLSPDELLRKRKAIFKHQSQKDSALFPGHDNREFWQRAEDRNRETAARYNQLGLAEYEAMEAFKRYFF